MTTPREAILDLLHHRGPGKTICPSEAARCLAPQSWRAAMAPIRDAAADLHREGLIAVTQKGAAVDPVAAKGAVRYGLPAEPEAPEPEKGPT